MQIAEWSIFDFLWLPLLVTVYAHAYLYAVLTYTPNKRAHTLCYAHIHMHTRTHKPAHTPSSSVVHTQHTLTQYLHKVYAPIHTHPLNQHTQCAHMQDCVYMHVWYMAWEMKGEVRGGVEWSRWGARRGGMYTHVRLIHAPAHTSRGPPGQVERVWRRIQVSHWLDHGRSTTLL